MFDAAALAFLNDVLQGLSQPARRLPCKYLYDPRGCALFDAICELDEYYLTRAELEILRRYGEAMAACIGSRAMMIELGSGSSVKTRILLDRLKAPVAYAPVDIAGEHLAATAAGLKRRYPGLEILPVCADFSQEFSVPDARQAAARRVVYFPGSTIGNFEPEATDALLARMASVAGAGGGLLIGVDLQKDRRTLEAAYNDARGVTAQFNLNLLARINRELGADFNLDQFEHSAVYNAAAGRIEMHLVSRTPQTVRIPGAASQNLAGSREQTRSRETPSDQHGHIFHFARGETICTEHSYKYDLPSFRRQAEQAGFRHEQTWTDAEERFAVIYFTVGPV